ncbi:MAG: hypothetical protein ACR2M2_08640 [Gaiellaceae bacterium]
MSARSTRVDVEEIEIMRTEKLLAIVLAAFFLIGGVWAYTKIDDIGGSAYRPPQAYFTSTEQAAVSRHVRAQQRAFRAAAAEQRARQELELAREAYRTALDAGRSAPRLERAYRAAQRDFATAQQAARAAGQEVAAAQPAADAARRRASKEALEASRQSEFVIFLLRLGLLLVTLAFGYWLFVRLRRSNSRYLPVAFAFVAFAAILALVMAGDYLTDYIDVQQFGPLVLSLAGIAMTLGAFWWLQRFLARRIPQRRVRKGECPFCGYPIRGGEHCEGCGRMVVGKCTTCQRPRRVGTFQCAECGAS